MASEEDLDALKARNLCCHCVGEPYLHADIRSKERRLKCDYCGRKAKAIRLEEMSERIEQAFESHYVRTSNHPDSWQQTLLSDRESDYDWERDGDPVVEAIAGAAEIPEAVAEDIQAILGAKHGGSNAAAMQGETEFSADSCYQERGTSDYLWQEEWRIFEHMLKTEARLFSRSAAALLASVFEGIETMSTRDGRPLVVDAGPGAPLGAVYRARVFQSDAPLKAALCRPDQHLGSPPSGLARAGRMNALGISVFYGANDPRVAIAEVRPPVGSRVAVARFDVIRPLRLLDLTALGNVAGGGSIFDPELESRLERTMFLRSLSERIVQPVMPDDEAFEYLPTQAIADFLSTEYEPPIDGIVFPSAQVAGDVLNVVLFHKAARVEVIQLPEGSEIEASTDHAYDENWVPGYDVVERVPPVQAEAAPSMEDEFLADFSEYGWLPPGMDGREPALRADLESIKVHHVRRVDFDTDSYDVRRRRWEKRDVEF